MKTPYWFRKWFRECGNRQVRKMMETRGLCTYIPSPEPLDLAWSAYQKGKRDGAKKWLKEWNKELKDLG